MKILVEDVHARVIGDPKTLALVRSICKARPKGYRYMPRYRSGHWDGYISVMDGINAFPAGLLDYVMLGLQEHGYTSISVEHVGCQPLLLYPISNDMLQGVVLRDYQMDAIKALLEANRGVAKMATNAGKTEVMAALLKAYDTRAVVVVHRKELLYQTAGRFVERLGGIGIGMVGDGICQPAAITVAMVQTLYSRPEILNQHFDHNRVLMVDECHHVSSVQMLDVLYRIPGSYRFGVSGTPLKYDKLADMKLIGATGPVVVDVTNEDLINGGYSAVPEVVMYVIESIDGWEDDYRVAYTNMISNIQRNTIIARVANEHKITSLVLVLVTRIEHGRLLQKMIPDSIFVHGSHRTAYRQDVIKMMRSGAGGVVIATQIFDEGVDIPGVDVLVLAGGGKSYVKLLQRVGRGMRKKAGDNRIVIVDFIDDTNDYLLSHSEERIETYTQEGFAIRVADTITC